MRKQAWDQARASLFEFIETRAFTALWMKLGLNDQDLLALQVDILAQPNRAPVITATGGVRKLRFAPPSWRTGKSGSLRVCYKHFEAYHVIVLALVYPKNVQDDLSADEKRRLRKAVAEFEEQLGGSAGLP